MPGKIDIDRKYLIASAVIILLLAAIGVCQMFPPETPRNAPTFHYGNTLLILDILCEETVKNVPKSQEVLLKTLREQNRCKEAAIWENPPGEEL